MSGDQHNITSLIIIMRSTDSLVTLFVQISVEILKICHIRENQIVNLEPVRRVEGLEPEQSS